MARRTIILNIDISSEQEQPCDPCNGDFDRGQAQPEGTQEKLRKGSTSGTAEGNPVNNDDVPRFSKQMSE